MVILFVPETRFRRKSLGAQPLPINKQEDTQGIEQQRLKEYSTEGLQEFRGSRMTMIQDMKPWSGTEHNISYWRLYFRPFPLVLYPACAFALLACELNAS